jgi:Glycine-rich domain
MRAPVGTMLRRGLWSPGGVAILISAGTLISVHAETSTPSPGTAAPATAADTEGIVYGCVNSAGNVRTLVPPPGQSPSTVPTCSQDELLIGWNQKGTPGPSGPPGPAGPKGADADPQSTLVLLQGALQSLIAPQLTQLRESLASLQVTPGGINGVAEFRSGGQLTLPDSVKNVLIEAWGGGGGGSGATDATDVSQPCFGGAGGGAGGYVRAVVAVPDHRLSIDIGPGGSAGTVGARGGDGGASKVSLAGGQELVTAEGGLGGLPASQTAAGGTGGVGGAGSATTTTILRQGGSGAPGTTSAEGPPPVAAAPPPASVAAPAAPVHASSPLASVDQILRDISLLPLLPVTRDRTASGAQAPVLPPVPGTAKTCGQGGAGGAPARGSLDPIGANGGQGGDQTTAVSLGGTPGGGGYVLVLW